MIEKVQDSHSSIKEKFRVWGDSQALVPCKLEDLRGST